MYLAAVAFGGDIWTSTNSGVTWTNQTQTASVHGYGWQALASSSDGTHLAAAVTDGDIFTSTNWGATWTDQTQNSAAQNQGWYSIGSSFDGAHLAAVAGGGIGGDIWTGVYQ
jgi:hypothetical protein